MKFCCKFLIISKGEWTWTDDGGVFNKVHFNSAISIHNTTRLLPLKLGKINLLKCEKLDATLITQTHTVNNYIYHFKKNFSFGHWKESIKWIGLFTESGYISLETIAYQCPDIFLLLLGWLFLMCVFVCAFKICFFFYLQHEMFQEWTKKNEMFPFNRFFCW